MRIGILGAGQLAQMLTQAALPLGFETLCYDPSLDACASRITKVIHAAYEDHTQLQHFIDAVDVITYETENIPLETAEYVAARRPLYPPIAALHQAQDRLHEKKLFQTLNIPTTRFEVMDAQTFREENMPGFPCVLKTRRFGYDGKGQHVFRSWSDRKHCTLDLEKTPAIAEEFITFDQEVSLIGVRGQDKTCRFYPLTKNTHESGILRISEAPFVDPDLQKKAEHYLQLIFETLDYCGVLAVEFFQKDGELIANEMAPRVHNTGHWTIEGAKTSQFENHIRAITGLPLGSTMSVGRSVMVNLIGQEPSLENCLAVEGLHYHSYGKSPREGRKLGHMTLVDGNEDAINSTVQLSYTQSDSFLG